MSAWSLRQRLLTSALALTVVFWIAAAGLSILALKQQIDRYHDGTMEEAGRILLASVLHEFDEHPWRGPVLPATDVAHQDTLVYQVFDAEGTMVLRSHSAPTTPLPIGQPGYHDLRDASGKQWRTLTMRGDDDTRFALVVAEPVSHRTVLIRDAALRFLAAATLLVAALGGALIWTIRRSVRAVEQAAGAIDRRSEHDLQPVDGAGLPAEMLPLTHAFDRLLGRMRALLERERQFTANAAHELRTPIAALRAQAQFGLKVSDPAAREAALREVLCGADRAGHAVARMLDLARVDAATDIETETLAATALLEAARTRACSREPALADRIHVRSDAAARLTGNAALLATALDNLLENAARYGGNGDIRLEGLRQGHTVVLAVEDEGPGLDQVHLQRLGERFYRGAASDAAGTGLGLSIVQRILELHGGTARFMGGEAGRGLRVELAFAATTDAAATAN